MTQIYVDLEGESLEQYVEQFPTLAYEHAYEHGWTDGLPIIPASEERVRGFVAASGRNADELIGIFPPRKGRVTVEVIAVNAVMAGCRAEYMPVLIAAIEAMTDPSFALEHMQVTTSTPTPFLLINGPIRTRLEINSGAGCLGPGWRANSTIGRAVRLILYNGGGGLPGVYSKSCFGSPLRYSYVCGENEETSPWMPFHVDCGFSREQSTVTVFNALSYCGIGASESCGPDEILRVIATNMPPTHGSGSAVVVLGINDAQTLHEAGFSKRDIRQRLWELARLPTSYFAEQFVQRERVAGRADAETVWRANSPDQIYVVIAGGPGPQNVYIAAKSAQTRVIQGQGV